MHFLNRHVMLLTMCSFLTPFLLFGCGRSLESLTASRSVCVWEDGESPCGTPFLWLRRKSKEPRICHACRRRALVPRMSNSGLHAHCSSSARVGVQPLSHVQEWRFGKPGVVKVHGHIVLVVLRGCLGHLFCTCCFSCQTLSFCDE